MLRPRTLHTEGTSTALGFSALDSVAAPFLFNTAVGLYALTSNTTGSGNTAMGDLALGLNEDGINNTAVGQYALRLNTTGSGNTAVGRSALEKSVGYYNPYSGMNFSENSAFGFSALAANTEGFYNTAVGAHALESNTVGPANTAVGLRALENHVGTGLRGYNVAIGSLSMNRSATGEENIAIGVQSLFNLLDGELNTVIGHWAGNRLGGSDSNNVLIQSRGVFNDNNTLRIGDGTGTDPRELDKAFIHGIFNRTVSSATDMPVLIDSSGQLGTTTSSHRYKDDIRDMGERTDRLLELRPVTFRYKRDGGTDPNLRYGLIAEEVAEIYPELVVFDDQGRPETVKYQLLSSMLLNELQRQHGAIAELRARLDALEYP